MSEEREDVETKSSDSPEVYQQTEFMTWFEKAFPWLLIGGAALGLTLMIFLPVIFFQEKTGDQLKAQSDLRLALLYTTGGVLTALGLLETYRKNTNDRAKANADMKATFKNQKHQAEVLEEQIRQFNENAFKERKAERRERCTKAVEQLGSKEVPVHMDGVYTLIGLVDELLKDESIEKYEDRLKEGQAIINNLCAYIRSPFTLASYYDELSQASPTPKGIYKDKEEEFYADKAVLESEADVRLSIIKEIHDRLQSPGKNTPGAWSDFEYDFSGSTFFYPVDLTKSYYKKPVNFSGATYQGWADFTGSTYWGRADFSGSIYRQWAYFRSSRCQSQANFSGSSYQGWTDFSGSSYTEEVDFYHSSYKGGANFSASSYKGWADFSDSTYKGGASFYHSSYKDGASFHSSTYQDEVYFSGSTYQWADFSNSTYWGKADFGNSIYQEEINLSRSTYQGETDFSRSIFCSDIYFGKDGDNSSFSRFTDCAPQFYDETNRKNTLFGSPDNDFSTENGRGYPVYRNLESLPLGCAFLTTEQKEYLADKFQEIEKINNKLLEIKDDEEKAELSKNLQSLNKEIHKWREEATTVKVEGTALGEEDN
ncbi:hypothetical protein [Rothia aeria]|uniref:hypothetical protein n=1 Tax=Rothia aeria TaxID=172042 RepID=UPI0028E9F613|nr:hypothetical protein [Rothia aeria]